MNPKGNLLRRTNSFTLGYWITILILVLVNFSTIIYGFHPHHDGLMLATVRLLRESFLNNGEWPFNQYGLFWAFPYFLVSLLVDGSNLLFAIRTLTLLMYAATGYLTYKIALDMYGVRVAKIALALFIILRPLGLEPLPWPSSISMILTITSLLLLQKSFRPKANLHANICTAIAGAMTSANLFSRVQVGLLILIATCIVLFRFHKAFTWYFLAGFTAFTSVFFIFLASQNWLMAALKDEFLFGWLIAGSDETDRSLPKTSLMFSMAILVIIIAYRFGKFQSKRFEKFVLLFILSFSIVVLSLNQQTFTTLFGKFVVGVILAFITVALAQFWKCWHARQVDKTLLLLFALASMSQIYPLFDVMHAWWGVSPLVILMAFVIDGQVFKVANKGFLFFIFISFSMLIIFPYVNSIRAETAQVSSDDLNFVRLPLNSQADYKNVTGFLQGHLSPKSSLLNLCSDARVFFGPRYSISASRYFIYWKTMGASSEIRHEIMKSKPTHVIVCNPFSLKDDEVISKFTSEPYFEVAESESISIYSNDK